MQWGDASFQTEAAGDFTSTCVADEKNEVFLEKKTETERKSYNSVDSRDIKLFYLQKY